MSQNYGAGKRERVKRSYFISLGYSFGIGAVLGLSLVLFGQTFLSLFTTEPAVAEAGMQRLLVMGLSYPISAFMDCTIAASRGLGRTIVPTFIVIMGSCVFRVVWVYTVFAFFGTLLSPVPAVCLLLDHHGHCRGDLFRPRLQRADAHLRKGINTLDIAFWGAWKGRPVLFWLDIGGLAVYDSKVNSEGGKLWKKI